MGRHWKDQKIERRGRNEPSESSSSSWPAINLLWKDPFVPMVTSLTGPAGFMFH